MSPFCLVSHSDLLCSLLCLLSDFEETVRIYRITFSRHSGSLKTLDSVETTRVWWYCNVMEGDGVVVKGV